MKAWRYFLLMVALVCLLTGCDTVETPEATTLPQSLKGYELYSWQVEGEWRFSLLPGTNRMKDSEEIMAAETMITDADALIALLGTIPEGEYVFWLAFEGGDLPPDEVISRVEQVCEQQGLILSITR